MAQRIKAPVALFANAVVLALLGNLAQYGELENAPMWKMMHNPLPDSPLIERPRLAIYVHSGTALRGRRDLQRQVSESTSTHKLDWKISVLTLFSPIQSIVTSSSGLFPPLQETQHFSSLCGWIAEL